MRELRAGFVVACLLVMSMTGSIAAAPTPEQRKEIAELGTLLTKAGNLYKESKFQEAGDTIKDIQTRVEKLTDGADEQLITQVEPIHKRLSNAQALLRAKGVTLAELKPLPAKAAPPKAAAAKRGTKAGAGVSFVRDVAPILNTRCGNCHVRGRRGMFSMATYESLMAGPPAGKVVFPGNVPGSDLIVKVQDKEMPPNGAGIPDPELATLKKWVEEGARFDGPSPTAQLTSFVPGGAKAAAAPAAAVQQATGSETVSFAKDIAPVLAQNCIGCHGTNNPRGNLSLFTMTRLLRGGDNDTPVLPGKGADSLIIKKLRGTGDGARMPMGRAPLDDATIAKIQKWIDEGATFDGPDSNQPVAEVAAVAKAEGATHEQLSADRIAAAEENWRLGMPGAPLQKKESTNFLVVGKVGEKLLTDVSDAAEKVATKVGDILKAPRDQPLVKGRMTLFVFADRYDYTEFGKMVEKRDLPPVWRGHFRYSIIDAYGALLMPRASDYSLDVLVAQQIGAIYVASQGRGVPHWFAEGSGRAIAARLAPASDQRVARWDDELSGVLGTLAKPDDFLTGQLPPEEADVCSFSFAKFLMSDNRRYSALLDGLRKGGSFAKVFEAAYGGPPAQLAGAWYRNPPRVKRGK
jgi:mono/diheme cytochrome c family protein